MKHRIALVVAMVGFFVACATKAPMPVAFQIPTRHIDYLKEVKPVLDRRCAVCHSCYNSPCQLKLDSFEGADRGATKRAVYNATRLKSMDPTRLFTDAQSTGEWRQKEFFSVTDSKASSGLNDSIFASTSAFDPSASLASLTSGVLPTVFVMSSNIFAIMVSSLLCNYTLSRENT